MITIKILKIKIIVISFKIKLNNNRCNNLYNNPNNILINNNNNNKIKNLLNHNKIK